MSDYQLYCFAQSGNAYRAALMLNLIGAKWEPIWDDFLARRRSARRSFRESINEMGEAPVLVDGMARSLVSRASILTYPRARRASSCPRAKTKNLSRCAWIIFDNQKVNGFLGPYRFLKNFVKTPADPAVMTFMKGRIDGALAIVNKRLNGRQFLVSDKPTIADVSLTAYLYYPAEEFGSISPRITRQLPPGWSA